MIAEDIYLLHAIKNNILTNWLQIVKEHMKNAALKRSLILPYAMFISKVLVLQGIDVRNEQKWFWNSLNVFNRDSVMSLRLVKTMNRQSFKGEQNFGYSTGSTLTAMKESTNFFPETNFEKYTAEQIRILHDKFENLAREYRVAPPQVAESSSEEESMESF